MPSPSFRGAVEILETRRLLAVHFDLVDLGVTTAPVGEGAYDVSGSVLGPNGVSAYADGQVGVNRLARSKARGSRFLPGTTDVMGLKVFPGFSVPHAARFRYEFPNEYRVVDVGTLDPVGPSVANAMGPEASIVGASQVPGGETHGFYATYRNARYYIFDLNDFRPAGVTWTVRDGTDVNKAGQILIGGTDAGGAAHSAVIRPTGAGTDGLELTGLTGGGAVEAVDLNDLGQAVGSGVDANGSTHALLWRLTRAGVGVADLGGLGGDSRATRMNNNGYVVGDATTTSDRSHGFLYDPSTGQLADLNALVDGGGLTIRHATAIDDNGQIVGEATDAAGNRHVVLLMPQDPMPALQPGTSLRDGVLRVNGTTGNDRISVEADAKNPSLLDVNLNGTVSPFDATAVIRLDIYGGPGDDVVELRDPPRQGISPDFHGNSGDDRLVVTGQYDSVTADGGAGNDLLQGNAGVRTTFRGGSGNDTLVSGGLGGILYGGAGDDSITGGNGNLIHGDAGNDTIVGGRGMDVVDGGVGDDSITTAGGNDSVTAGDGNDVVDTGAGDDRVWGGAGDDVIHAGEGDDLVYGEAGNDTLWGQSGDDTLTGDGGFTTELLALPMPTPGNDSLDGGAGNDYLVGSRESMTLADDNGRDTMTGGPGGDIINARGDDVADDAAADDVVPARDTAGAGPLAVQQTATLDLRLPPTAAGGAGVPVALPDGLGKFAGSTFYADADGTLHMRDTVAREFTLGEFFRNWGVPVSFPRVGRNGRVGAFADAEIKVNGVVNPALDHWVVHAGDVITVVVSV